MAKQAVDISAHVEAIGRYLGRTFPTTAVDRYEDQKRRVVGFRFIGSVHGNVEFTRALLETLPRDENSIALELHLRHLGSEITDTPRSQRLVFTVGGAKREPTA